MRVAATIIAVFTALAAAQQNAINVQGSTLDVTAGQPTTITWTNPSSGTVTIKLQQGSAISPNSGLVVASGIEASAMTATFTVPANEVDTFEYTIEIVDDTNPSNYNFSPNFNINGASGTPAQASSALSLNSASATGSASASGSASSATATTSGSTNSASTATATSSGSSSASASTMASTMATTTTSGSSTHSSAASTTASASTAQTSAPNSNGAGVNKAQGALLALLGAAIALF